MLHYVYRLLDGTIFIVRQYSIKASRFAMMPSPELGKIGIEIYDIEIDVNHFNAVGEVEIVDPTALPHSRHVPSLKYLFFTRQQLRQESLCFSYKDITTNYQLSIEFNTYII